MRRVAVAGAGAVCRAGNDEAIARVRCDSGALWVIRGSGCRDLMVLVVILCDECCAGG